MSAWLGIPNRADVLSNALFCAAGAIGLARVGRLGGGRWHRATTLALFAALFLTGVGSAYYHWAPSAERLFWDRLPLTCVITALFALVLGDRLDARVGAWTALPLVLALRPAGAIDTRYLAWVLALYAAAKLCELLDRQIFSLLCVVSGHTLKHLLAGCGACALGAARVLTRPCAHGRTHPR
jgi:hypothetical protein